MAEVAAIATIIGTVASIGGTVFSVISGIQQANYASSVAKRNALIQDQNAKQAVRKSQIDQQEQDLFAAAALGDQEAAQSSSGVSVASGAFVSARDSARTLARKDANNIRYGGELQKVNYQDQAAGYTAEAANAKNQIPGIVGAGITNLGSTLVTSASKFGSLKKKIGIGTTGVGTGDFGSRTNVYGRWY